MKQELLDHIIQCRPVGSEANHAVMKVLEQKASQLGYPTLSLPFECKVWSKDDSYLSVNGQSYKIYPSPFSASFEGEGDIIVADSMEELAALEIGQKILFIRGELAREPMMPKNFPFYYPEEHKALIELLEEKQPKAILALTDKHPMYGLSPYPLFDDGNFIIPSAYIRESLENEAVFDAQRAKVTIASQVEEKYSHQLVFPKKAEAGSKGKVIVCAHMDTKYDTPGAMDNAVGLAVLVDMMQCLKAASLPYDIDFVPFNGEEYYEAKGQLAYLGYCESEMENIKLVINIDSPCAQNSKTAFSLYNFDEDFKEKLINTIEQNSLMTLGEEWYAGDHAMFVFRGIPCLAVTSSNLFESVLEVTHTPRDTRELIDESLIGPTAEFLSEIIKAMG